MRQGFETWRDAEFAVGSHYTNTSYRTCQIGHVVNFEAVLVQLENTVHDVKSNHNILQNTCF